MVRQQRMLITEEWNAFAKTSLPKDMSKIQRQEMKWAFYAGAMGIVYALTKVLLADGADDLQIIENIKREFSNFADAVKIGQVKIEKA